jgi:hypothetical protein
MCTCSGSMNPNSYMCPVCDHKYAEQHPDYKEFLEAIPTEVDYNQFIFDDVTD